MIVGAVPVRVNLHKEQSSAHAEQQPRGNARGQIQPARVRKCSREFVRQIETLVFIAPDEKQKNQSGCDDVKNQPDMERAGVGKAEFVKGQLQLQPAQKHTEGTRAADIAGKLQRLFSAAIIFHFHLRQSSLLGIRT